MGLLGEDGRGYELAQKLESCGVWRSWLGDSLYTNLVQFLSSPSAWESFMSCTSDESKSKAQIQLQLRARALLFDKASISLFLQSPPNSSSVSKLNPSHLELHGDDVYFTFENSSNVPSSSSSSSSKNQNKLGYSVGSRYGVSEVDYKSQRFRHEEFPETWYSQFIEKYRTKRPYTLLLGDHDSDKRSPEQMSAYLRLVQNHKRRRMPFKEDKLMGNSVADNISNMQTNFIIDDVINSIDEDSTFFPETMFTLNCVPDNALPPVIEMEEKPKVEFYGVLDTLPQIMTARSSVMIERLGIRPEGGNRSHGKNGNRTHLSEEQALQKSYKVIALMLRNVGFEGATELPMEALSQLLSCHICKLGGILRVLADNYRKQCSATELIKMFLQSAKQCNLGTLAELVKDSPRNSVQQQTQQLHGIPSQLQAQLPNPIRQPQQIARQINPQMQQMVHSRNIAFQQQQQWERMQRRLPSTPRPVMDMDKDRPLVQVKLENPSELPLDANVFNDMNPRHPQMQFRQQPIPAMPNANIHTGNQFRQMASVQVPQVQSPNMGIVRAPPVKVEGFQELMGGDASMKQDSDGNKLTSPSK